MRGWHVCKHAHAYGLVSPVTTQEVLKCTPNSPFRKMHAYDSFVEPTTKPSVDEQRSVSDSKWHPLKHDLMDDGEEAYYSRAYSYSHSQGTGEREANVFFAGLGEDLTGLTDSNMIHSAYKAMTDRQDSFLQAKRASISAWELLLYFVCGTGVSAPFIAILSSLSYFSLSYGDPKVFLYLNACVYVPTIFVSTLQASYDGAYNKRYGNTLAYNCRIYFTYIVSTGIMVASPSITGLAVGSGKHLGHLMLIALAYGILHQISYGSFYQIASFIPSDGKCLASFSMGYQGAGFAVLLAQVLSGFNPKPTELELQSFFLGVGAIEVVAIGAYTLLNTSSPSFKESMQRQDAMERSEQYMASKIKEFQVGAKEQGERNASQPLLSTKTRFWELLRRIFPAALSLLVVIFGSIFLLTFYAYIESDGLFGKSLPTYLFFIKLGSDTISRPLTVCYQPFKSSRGLMVASLLRLLFIPFFFAYIGGMVPKNDIGILVGVGLFSMTSGFFVTNAYQFAANMVDAEKRVKVASMMSFLFTVGLNLAIGMSIIVQEFFTLNH